MDELLLRTETLLAGLATLPLLGIGVGAIVVGLVLWLGGTRYSTAITGVLGAVAGSVAGLLVNQWLHVNPWLCLFIGAAVLAGLFILVKNILVLVLAVLVFSAASGTGYLAVVLDRAIPQSRSQAEAQANQALQYFSGMSLTDRLNYMNQISRETQTFTERLKALLANTWEALGPNGWMVVFALIGGAILGALLIWLIAKIVIALAYSLVGTAGIFIGAQAALLAVGVPLVSDLGARRWLLPIAFLVMAVIGWVWQLFVAGEKKPKKELHKKSGESH
jgi:hypothetical protein